MRRLLALALVLGACGIGREPSRPAVPEGVRVVSTHVKTGSVGARDPVDTTYVLAAVDNQTPEDRAVAIDGDLVDAAGKTLAAVASDEIRIPAGKRRAFALVADRARPEATSARLRVHHATPVDFPESFAIDAPAFTPVGELKVATGAVRNVTTKDGTATLCAAFYAADGRVLARPFVVIALPGGSSRPLRFEGPKDAVSAEIYVSEQIF